MVFSCTGSFVSLVLNINPYLTNRFSHHLGESTFTLRGIRRDIEFLFYISDEIPLSKQNSPRWDAAICGVTSGAILFRPGLILFVNHDYFYSIENFFNQKLFCNRRFLQLKLFLFLFDYFSKLPVIVINLTNKL